MLIGVDASIADSLPSPSSSPFVARDVSRNQLLASLPSSDYERIAPYLQRTPTRVKELLYRQDTPIERVYLPGGGTCALIKSTADRHTAEVAAIGREGVIGASAFHAAASIRPKRGLRDGCWPPWIAPVSTNFR